MIIYMVKNKINGKMYIGQTVRGLEQRTREHITVANRNIDNTYFHCAIRKHGADNFNWTRLHTCDNIEELNKLETYYIGLYDTYENGYNLTLGGNGSVGYEVSENTKRKISESLKGKNNPNYGKVGKDSHWYGRRHTEETKKKMSKTQREKGKGRGTGRKHTEETKRKISLNHARCPSYGMLGKKHSKEAKKKLSKARKGKYTGKDSSRARAIIVDNKRFDTRKEAGEFLNVSAPTISNRIKMNVTGYSYAD